MQKTFKYGCAVIKIALGEDNLLRKVELKRGASNAPKISYGEMLDYEIDFSTFSAFEKAVLQKARGIPYGKAATYGELARTVGKPRAVRAVGNVMAKNPFPILVPCHRVIKSDLSLGKYSGGTRLKRMLLESEGVAFEGEKVKREFVHRFKVGSKCSSAL